MIIKNSADTDIEHISKIAHLVWGDLYFNESFELQKFIYEFTAKYYFVNKKYSLFAFEDGLKGVLLAALKSDKNHKFPDEALHNLDDKDRSTARNFYDYIEQSGKAVKSLMNDNDIMLGMFVSTQKGCGKMMLSKFFEICKENKIQNMYLWTDTVCDYDYYEKNSFELMKEFGFVVNNRKLKTLIFKKEI